MKLDINGILMQFLHNSQLRHIPNKNLLPQIHGVGLKDRGQITSAKILSPLLENSEYMGSLLLRNVPYFFVNF